LPNEVNIRITATNDTAAARNAIRADFAATGAAAGDDLAKRAAESMARHETAKLPVEAGNPIDDAWRSQVQTSIRGIAREALKIPVTPDTATFRDALGSVLEDLRQDTKAEIPAEVADADVFKQHVERVAKQVSEQVKAEIPVEADEQSAQNAGKKAGNGFVSGIFQQRPLIATAIVGGILAGGPLVTAAGDAMGGALLISLGVALQKGNPAVDMAWRQLTQNAIAVGTNASAGMVGPIVQGLGQIDAAVQRDAPAFQQLFSSAGKDIPILVQGIDTMVSNSLPGFTAAMAASQPVAQGVADIMGQVGTAASAIGSAMASSSSSAHTALTALGSAVDGVGHALATLIQFSTQLTSGALPVLVSGFNALLGAAGAIVQALTPIAPALGQIAAIGGEAFAAFKLAGLATTGVTALGKSLNDLSTGLTAAGTKMLDSSMGSSRVGSAMASAAGGAATLAGSAATVAETVAGPLGIALGLASMGLMLFGQSSDQAAQKAQQQQQVTMALAQALEQSGGAIDSNVHKTLAQQLATDDNSKALQKYGVSVNDMQQTLLQSNGAVDAQISSLQKQRDSLSTTLAQVSAGNNGASSSTSALSQQIQTQIDRVDEQMSSWQNLAKDMAGAIQTQKDYQAAVLGSASAMGIHVDKASASQQSLANLDSTLSSSANLYLQQIAPIRAYVDAAAAAAGANVTADQSFKQLDQAVSTAQQSLTSAANGVASAQHSLVDASFAVDNARHSEQQAVLAVTQAQFQYQQSLYAEKQAQQAVADARAAAAQQLEQLKRQVTDQADTVDAAKLRLVQAQQAVDAAGLHGKTLAGLGDPTVANQAQYQLLLDLSTAQHGLNDAQATQNDLNKQNDAAQKAGIEGAAGVIQAEQQLVGAKNAVAQAAQGVSNAQYAEQQASHAVSDALWSQQQAAFAVTQADQSEYTAELALTKAKDDASRTLDLNTAAGQRNWKTVEDMWFKNYAVTGSVQDATKATEDETTKLGFNQGAVQGVIDTLNGLSGKNFAFSVTGTPTLDLGPVRGILMDPTLGLFTNQQGSSGGAASAGRLAAGGPVSGAGGPRDDANLIWASAGEYMQSADAHAYYGTEFMDAINKKRLPRYADGGSILGVNAGAAAAWGLYETAGLTANALGARPPLPTKMPAPGNFSRGSFGLGGLGLSHGTPAAGGTPLAAQQYAASVLAAFGWGADQMGPLIALWNQESGWNPYAVNPSSGAYGIPQSLGHGHPYDLGDYVAQINWGLSYIRDRYGSPGAAEGHEQAFNWYAAGGPASGLIGVGDRGPELIRVPNGSTVMSNVDSRSMMAGSGGGTHEIKSTIEFSGNVDTALASMLMKLFRTGAIQIRQQYVTK
jgi:hypothetical protein